MISANIENISNLVYEKDISILHSLCIAKAA